jgi:D-alanyl-lipoteichoic acid acyltransferase DltB (MBOAT superfamily)
MYADFSGYSDMAIGLGKLLGLRVARNFNYPLYGRNIAEYWRGWHISLTSWITDYVFIPLNIQFRNVGKWGMIAAIIINMVLVGLWHEAKLTWVVFGLYHGLLFIPLILSGAFSKKSKFTVNKYGLPSLKDFMGMAVTFVLFAFGMIISRADSMSQVWEYLHQIGAHFASLDITVVQGKRTRLAMAFGLLIFEWYSYRRKMEYGIETFGMKFPRPVRWICYYIIFFLMLKYFITNIPREFIYFQF